MSNNRCEHMPSMPGIPSRPINGTDRILYFKNIMTSREDAVKALYGRELDPGQMAVARYYLGYSDQTIPPTWTGIRMVLGIGGTGHTSDDELYIFDDSNFTFTIKDTTGEDINMTLEEAIQYLLYNYTNNLPNNPDVNPEKPSGLTEEQVRAIVLDEISKNIPDVTALNNRIDGIDRRISEVDARVTADHENFSRDIDELRNKIDNLDLNIDLSSYATIAYVDARFNALQIPDITEIEDKVENLENSISNLNSKIDSSLNEILNNISSLENTFNENISNLKNEFDSSLSDVNSKVDSKVDATYVEDYFNTNVKSSVDEIIADTNIPGIVESEIEKQNIQEQVSTAVDEKLANFEGVTTETLDEALQNNEYFTTTVLSPIETVTEKVNTIETQIKDLDADIDGGEEEDWILYFNNAESEDDIQMAIIANENFELSNNVNLSQTIILDENADIAMNIANNDLSKNGTGAVIRVNGGKLIIDGNNGHINGDNNGQELGDNHAIRCSNNGHVIINGGYYTVGDDGKNGGNALIYCTEGLIEIYGGTFEYTNSNDKHIYTLNCQDKNYKLGLAKIVVYGGTFKNGYDPANSKSENPAGNFVANGYKSVYDELTNSYTVIPE